MLVARRARMRRRLAAAAAVATLGVLAAADVAFTLNADTGETASGRTVKEAT